MGSLSNSTTNEAADMANKTDEFTELDSLLAHLNEREIETNIDVVGQLVRKRNLSKSLIFGDVMLKDKQKLQIMFRVGEAGWTKETLVQLNWDIHIGDEIKLVGTLKKEESDRYLLVVSTYEVISSWKITHQGVPFDVETLGEADTAPVIFANKQEYSNMIQLRGHNACKYHFSNASCTRGDACHFWHGEPSEYKALQEEWIQKRAQQKRELTLQADDPHDPHTKELKSNRARIFAEWLVDTFGIETLQNGSGVIDVAGGKGDIDYELWILRAIPSTLVDPRVVKTRKVHLKYIAKHGMTKWNHFLAELNDKFINEHSELFQSCSALIGMHPDEATEPIVDAALRLGKPFAVVPCCVMSRLFPDRICNEEKVATYDTFVKYLKEKHPSIQSAFLPFGGRNQQDHWLFNFHFDHRGAMVGNKAKGVKKSGGSAAKGGNNKRKNASSTQGTGSKKQKNEKPSKKKPVKKAKIANPAQPEEDEDIEIDDEDVEFFESHEQYSSFLSSMDPKAISKSTKKTALKKPEKPRTLEEIEAKPRTAPIEGKKSTIDMSTKLPVKTFDGALQTNTLMQEIVEEHKEAEAVGENEEDEEDEDESDDDVSVLGSGDEEMSDLEVEEITDVSEPIVEEKPAISPEELKVMQARRLHAKKEELALLCETILESPEEAVKKCKDHPDQFSKFQQLHAMCEDTDVTLSKLAMLSELSVLLDVLPDYRIRAQSDNDSSGPQKKKVKEMKEFEMGLLNQYQRFLKFLSSSATQKLATINPNQQSRTPAQHLALSVAETAVKCLAELLKVKYSFNFNINLITAMVPFADIPYINIQRPACEAFEIVFKADKSGLAPLEIVKQISNYVKKRNHRVSQRMIKTLLAMPLDVTMEAGEIARRAAKSSRKKRRRQQKEGDTIATGLKEAEAVVDKSERDKTQADILHELVLIYFRVLKNSTYSPAMPAVLEGLTKFAYLINLEIMIDLMKVLKTLLTEDILPLAAALQAILTGIKTLQGPGQELRIDEKDFVDHLYRLLLRFAEGENVACFNTALLCVEAVFIKRKEIVVDRVAAFIKRLLVVSMYLHPHQILAVSALIRSLFHRYSKLHQLLENDQDRVASGIYRADVNDPDFSNPYASACWELSLLGKHYHPVVGSFSLGTANLEPSLPNEYPKAMLDRYDTIGTGGFVPRVAIPKPNPLHAKIQKNIKQKKNTRPVFVLPSYTATSSFMEECLELDAEKPSEVDCFFVSVE